MTTMISGELNVKLSDAHARLRTCFATYLELPEVRNARPPRYYFHKDCRGYVMHVKSGIIHYLERHDWTDGMAQLWCDA